jgi:hypothetical protein
MPLTQAHHTRHKHNNNARVLVVGCSAEPWLVPKKDEPGFMSFWGKMLHVPLPDYAARRVRVGCWAANLLLQCLAGSPTTAARRLLSGAPTHITAHPTHS